MSLVVHVAGARPNFPKLAPVWSALAARGVRQRLVHTGQHYDDALSEIFFRQLALPRPDVNLGVGSGSHAAQTAALLVALEREFATSAPSLVMVYGDVNSTLAAALVAAKLGIAAAHVEAGLRSFDRSMPEEINRIVTDRLCELLFVTCPEGVEHLAREGATGSGVHFVGNPMIDTLLANLGKFDVGEIRARHALAERYAVATLHRPSNVDDPDAVRAVVAALHEIADVVPVYLPLHPRGRANLVAAGIADHPRLRLFDPLGYLEFLAMVRGAALVITDSGGVQEETTMLGVPCLTMRPNTERPITVTQGTNRLVRVEDLAARCRETLAGARPPASAPPPLWDGRAGERIADIVAKRLGAGTEAA